MFKQSTPTVVKSIGSHQMQAFYSGNRIAKKSILAACHPNESITRVTAVKRQEGP